jgi:hypothetical protein
VVAISAVACVALVAGASAAAANNSHTGFGFNAKSIAGFPNGSEVRLTGGGAFDSVTGFVHSGGGFRCTTPVTQGPLMGCGADEGVRWDTVNLMAGTMFKCTVPEALRPATTSGDTVVLLADFYRAGDGNDESFTAQMIVTTQDLDHDIAGVQNVWVQGVGCGTALTNFSS